jgi:hypothetical protein
MKLLAFVVSYISEQFLVIDLSCKRGGQEVEFHEIKISIFSEGQIIHHEVEIQFVHEVEFVH